MYEIEFVAYSSIGQGTWAIGGTGSSDLMNRVWNNNASATDGDNISYKVWLAAGTYTLRLIARTGSELAILDFDIDAAEVASFDTYGSSVDNVVFTETGISVGSTGLKTLKIRVDGKNPAGSNYKARIESVALWRTA